VHQRYQNGLCTGKYILEEQPVVHGWVFDLRTGKIIDLEIDFEKILKDIQKIYNLTGSDWVMSRKTK
jgi:carbonic anhydrase